MSLSRIKTQLKCQLATNFISAIGRTTPAADNMYCGLGRSIAWTNELVPPDADDTNTFDVDLRSNIIGIKKVVESNVSHVIRRINWTTGTVYDMYSSTDTDLYAKDFYVMTDAYNVYKCLDNNSGAASVNKPTGTSTSPIITADGYTWKFMYNVPTGDVIPFLTTNWIPVPTGSRKTAEQLNVEAAASYSVGSPIGGHGANAVEELGAYYILFTARFEDTEGGVLPVDVTYRQVFLLQNPKDSLGVLLTGNVYNASQMDTMTGSLMYAENRTHNTRIADTTEDIKIIVEF